jgi:hypothetical protein
MTTGAVDSTCRSGKAIRRFGHELEDGLFAILPGYGIGRSGERFVVHEQIVSRPVADFRPQKWIRSGRLARVRYGFRDCFCGWDEEAEADFFAGAVADRERLVAHGEYATVGTPRGTSTSQVLPPERLSALSDLVTSSLRPVVACQRKTLRHRSHDAAVVAAKPPRRRPRWWKLATAACGLIALWTRFRSK